MKKSPLPHHEISTWIQVFKSSDYLISSIADKLDHNWEKTLLFTGARTTRGIKVMVAFREPTSTQDQFSSHKSSLTGHGNSGDSNQLLQFIISNPSPTRLEKREPTTSTEVENTRGSSHSPVLPVEINKMLPQRQSSRVQVQNGCLGEETKKPEKRA